MRKILLNILSAVFVLAVFYFLGNEFYKNWHEIRSVSFRFNIPLLLLASFAYALGFLVLAFGWHTILQYLHHPIPFAKTLLYFCMTQPAKYIPGKVWIAVTRMKFCKPHGVPHSITLLTTGAEATFEIFAGTYISLVTLANTNLLGGYSVPAMIGITFFGILFLVPRVFYFFVNLFLSVIKKPRIEKDRRAAFRQLLLLQLNYIVGMFLWGLAQAIFLKSLIQVDNQHLFFLISIGVFSNVASILAVFTPSGLGVREGIWYIALKNIAAPGISLVYAFTSRLWTIILEVIFLFIALPFYLFRRRPE